MKAMRMKFSIQVSNFMNLFYQFYEDFFLFGFQVDLLFEKYIAYFLLICTHCELYN